MTNRKTTLYPHPFSKAYWHDAAGELKDVRMLVITALMIALRVALKPLAIYLGPQMAIQTATLATALGAMLYGPVVAIPAALISDTVGFMLHPTGDYFLPFALTEIASTMIYALCLYRAKPSATRVVIARFLICFLVNVVLQQLIFAWQYTYLGNPEKAKESITGMMTVARIFKNLFFFPIESVVITLFLKVLTPVTARVGLTPKNTGGFRFTGRQIVTLVLLTAVGICSAGGFLTYRYANTSRSADYTAEQRVEANQAMLTFVLENSQGFGEENTVTIVEAAYRPLFGRETTYEVAVYTVNEGTPEAFWGLSKSKAAKNENLTRAASATLVVEEKTGKLLSFQLDP